MYKLESKIMSLKKNRYITISTQNLAQFINSFFRYSRFYSPMTQVAKHIFYQSHPKIIEATFSFPAFVKARKKSVYSINSFFRCNQF